MKIRKALPEDSKEIKRIIEEAKASLKRQGVDQWQNGYPNEETITADIASGFCYVAEEVLKGAAVLSAAAVITPEEEMSYRKIYEGSWLTQGPYLVIHRIAAQEERKRSGCGSALMEFAVSQAVCQNMASVRIDTHRDNLVMQSFLKRQGFFCCGAIYLEDGGERLAYERVLSGTYTGSRQRAAKDNQHNSRD